MTSAMSSAKVKPALRVRRGRLPGMEEVSGFFSAEAASWSSSATKAGMDDKQTLIFLHTRVSETMKATRRQRNVFGRIYNSLTGEMPDYVLLPGNILMRVLKVVRECPDWMQTTGEYEVRIDIAQELLAKFKAFATEDMLETAV